MALRELYLQPMIEEVLRKSNRDLAAYVSEVSFPNYTKIAGGTAVFTRLNISAAWQNVAGTGGAPVNSKDTFLITDQTAYGNMVGDSTQNFIQQFFVGDSAAVMAQQDARLMPQFSAAVDWDQTIPSDTAGKHGGLYFHRMAVGMLPVLEARARGLLHQADHHLPDRRQAVPGDRAVLARPQGPGARHPRLRHVRPEGREARVGLLRLVPDLTTSGVLTEPAHTNEVLVTVATDATAGEVTIGSAAIANAGLTSLAAGNWARVFIRRVGTDALDTHPGRVLLVGVSIKDT
jgi:hypothetical protein